MTGPVLSNRDRIAWAVLLALAGLAVVGPLGLVSPRPRRAVEPPGVPVPLASHEPRPSPLVAARPPRDAARTSASRDPSAGETAHGAVDAGPESSAPPPASLEHEGGLAVLEIEVLRAGRAEAGATVELWHAPREVAADAPDARLLRTDAEGRLRLALEPGEARVVAWSDDACALPGSAALEPGATATLALELEPAYPVRGRVIDARTGAPVEGAAVALWTFAERDVVTTGPAGDFLHPRFPARAPAQQVMARAPGYGTSLRYLRVRPDGSWKVSAATRGEAAHEGSGTPWVELVLVPELAISGRLVDPDGQPVVGARVTAEGFFHALPSVASRDAAAITSDAAGRFRLAGLRSDVGHALVVEAPGFALDPLEIAAGTDAAELGDLVLAPEGMLAGVALDLDGVPLTDVEVVLHLALPGPGRRAPEGLDVGARLHGHERRARTATDGSFLFTGLAPRPVTLWLEHEGARAELTLEPRADGTFDAPCLVPSPALALARRR